MEMYEKIENQIITFFPNRLKLGFKLIPESTWNVANEIRLRAGKVPMISTRNGEQSFDCINFTVTIQEISSILSLMCQNSIYAVQEEIRNGFITLKGGHRVGIVGRILQDNGDVSNMKFFSGLNIRIAREIIGSADNVMDKILYGNTIKNTLIASPPGKGKTTVLRDAVRQISNRGFTVGLIDERSEIAACYNGVPQNDVGVRTDVLDNSPKAYGIRILVRSMAPKVIATDEIFSLDDANSILEAIGSGVKVLCTAHGNSIDDLMCKEGVSKLIKSSVFEQIIFL